MTLSMIGWLFTFGVLLHNLEEALYLPAWSMQAGRWHVPVAAGQFRFAVTVLSVFLIVTATLSMTAAAGSLMAYLMAGYVLSMVLNVLLPHALATIGMRRYMPGLATALLFNLPLGLWYLMRALTEHRIEWSVFIWSGPLTAAMIVAMIPALFVIGRGLK
ncbi:HXXEE domain-containing protein [Gynuella sunshinyii]|uniref:HXXEE domain-containing protein n=1 Tax=Gynuella sunshinyii YC6258 TaxID=1445510 RepID=A0A0C5W018_9GAMM|nr:HXXEE domain-containing protein [Gynuella sunshinyii]AJQ96024.1 hypothetical Protein YC6258_03988 [Gynuella sunshinyii YC6258]